MEHRLAVWICKRLVAECDVLAEADVTVAKGRRCEGSEMQGIAYCLCGVWSVEEHGP